MTDGRAGPDLGGVTAAPGPRNPSLRAGSVKVAVAVAAFGISTYVFTVLASRALGPDRFADFSVFWGITYGIGLGVSNPFEQEMSRRVSALTAQRRGPGPVLRTGLLGALVIALPIVVILLPVAHALAPVAGEMWALWASSALAVVALSVTYVVRGTLSGTRHFGSYATQFGVEGGVRLLAVVALFLAGVASPWPYAFVIPLALVLAVVLTVGPLRADLRHHAAAVPPPAQDRLRLRTHLRFLAAVMISSTIMMSLVNFGPVAVKALTPHGQSSAAGSFLAAALIARVPIFLFAAVQAVLIPQLVATVVRRDRTAFARTLRLVLLPTAGLGLVGVLGCLAIGPEALRLMAGPGFDLPRTDIVLLALSTALILGTLVLQPAAQALEQHWATVAAWVAAGVTFVIVALLPLDPVRAVAVAIPAASAVALAGLALVVRRGLARPARSTG